MTDWRDKHFWVTLIKLIAGAMVLIFLVGAALWYSLSTFSVDPPKQKETGVNWGIAGDHPVRNRR